jgi:hypothetical protein
MNAAQRIGRIFFAALSITSFAAGYFSAIASGEELFQTMTWLIKPGLGHAKTDSKRDERLFGYAGLARAR